MNKLSVDDLRESPGSLPVKELVREKYGEFARQVQAEESPRHGSASRCCDPITSNLYSGADIAAIPKQALRASLGCGNPTALADLRSGEIVLDLGSGGGMDVLVSARRVGPTGQVYGLDMTDGMLALARENQRKSGVANAEFLKGEIEHIPLPDNFVDVIISNCVLNLSADKSQAFREAFRVLKPGGRIAFSDVVTRGNIASEVRQSILLWIGCVAGALDESAYRTKLAGAGFEQIQIEPTRIYQTEDAREFLASAGLYPDAIAPPIDGKVLSAIIRAVKPARPGQSAAAPAPKA